MAIIPKAPIRVSPGVYRNPGGALMQSKLPPKVPVAPGVRPTPRPAVAGAPLPQETIPKAQPAGVKTPPPKFTLGTDLNSLNTQLARTQREIARRGKAGAGGYGDRLSRIQAAISGLTPPPPAAGPAPTVEAPVDNTDGDKGVEAAPTPEGPTFRSVYDFVPKDFSNDPTYQFQKEQGMKDINRLMASRGLTGSGAEIEGNARFLNELGSNTAAKYLDLAQGDASRYDNQAQNEAMLKYNQGNDQWTRMMNLLNYTQKNNPFQEAVSGLDKYSGLNMENAKNRAAFMKDLYQRIQGPSGGGGGGAPPPFIPPGATGPDTSMSDIMRASNRGQSNSNLYGDIANIIGSIYRNW